jgi:acyl CoA:acetate/3-ketoacid CoA transferase alpha subunit
MMAMAGKITIAEVEELVEAGELDPDQIHTWNLRSQNFPRRKLRKTN